MIKSILHLSKIHRKVVLGNAPIIVQNMFRKTPKTFDAVDVIFGTFVDEVFSMLHRMMLAQAFERIVAPEFVGKVHRSLSRFFPDDGHEVFRRDAFHDPRIDPSVALQKAQNDVFAFRSSSSLALSFAAEIAFVKFDLARHFLSLQFGDVIDRLSHFLVHASHRLIVEAEIACHSICRLLLVEPFDDRYFSSQLFQRLLFSTSFVAAADISPLRPMHLERSAKNALSTPLKVGRTTENRISFLVPYGYFNSIWLRFRLITFFKYAIYIRNSYDRIDCLKCRSMASIP
jgi:hypothetical protein